MSSGLLDARGTDESLQNDIKYFPFTVREYRKDNAVFEAIIGVEQTW